MGMLEVDRAGEFSNGSEGIVWTLCWVGQKRVMLQGSMATFEKPVSQLAKGHGKPLGPKLSVSGKAVPTFRTHSWTLIPDHSTQSPTWRHPSSQKIPR